MHRPVVRHSHDVPGDRHLLELRTEHSATEAVHSTLGRPELDIQLKLNLTKIAQWEDVWYPKVNGTKQSPSDVWGLRGREDIEELRRNIDLQIDAIRSYDSKQSTRDFMRTKKVGKLRKLWRPFTSQQPALNREQKTAQCIDDLGLRIDELWDLSETIFRSLHGVSRGVASPDVNLRTVLKSRHLSCAIYHASYQSQHVKIDLDMNLLNNEHDTDNFADIFDWSDLKLTYHFLVRNASSPRDARDISIQSCEDSELAIRDDDGLDQDRSNLSQLSHVRSRTEAVRRLSVPGDDSAYRVYTRSSATYTWDLQYLPFFHSISQNQDPSTTPPSEHLRQPTLIEKVLLAYRIVECGLFLVGTPWAWLFTSDNLRCRSMGAQNEYYLHMDTNNLVDCGQRITTPRSHSSSSEEAISLEREQIRKIGLLLVEIALEKQLTMTDLEATPQLLETQVSDRMGATYKTACDFCLGGLFGSNNRDDNDSEQDNVRNVTTDDNDDYNSTIEAYYFEAFMKLRDVLHTYD